MIDPLGEFNMALGSSSKPKIGTSISNQKHVVPIYIDLGTTPNLLSISENFRELPYFALIDNSAEDTDSRYSYMTASPFLVLRFSDGQTTVETQGKTTRIIANPFETLRSYLAKYRTSPLETLPPFQGGAVGYLAYELGNELETIGKRSQNDHGLPEIYLGFYDWVISRDSITGSTWAVATAFPESSVDKAEDRLQWIDRILSKKPQQSSPINKKPSKIMGSTFSHEKYIHAVKKVKTYINEGDIYQVNLSQRFESTLNDEPWNLYRNLRESSPAPYASFLEYPEVSILSASPELYINTKMDTVSSKPIKGTRLRGNSKSEDRSLSEELRMSEKDRAENIMIVDVSRNDLGRICVPGTIKVPSMFEVEIHPTVLHLVSTVTGNLIPNIDSIEVIKAVFPGASITGAPKIRAMQIIDSLEPVQRSIYCGGIGYIGFDDTIRFSMAIRIMIVRNNRVFIPVGGGIVYDSDPESEYQETLHKASGAFKSLGINRFEF